MAPSRRRRLRRPHGRIASNGRASNHTTFCSGPLRSIGENTVVDISEDDVNATVTRPSSKKQSNKNKRNNARKKRPRESVILLKEDKRGKQLETLLDELESQVQEQCDELVAAAKRRAEELEMELKMQLLILPEAVRQMPWKTFVEDFGGDLDNAIYSLSQSRKFPSYTRPCMDQNDIVAASPCSIADLDESDQNDEDDHDRDLRSLARFTTPLDRRRAGTVPSTISRTARKGETTYSVRGSPIIPNTVAKAPVGSLVAVFEKSLEPTTCLQLDSDRLIDLSRPEELSVESRGEATSKLKALQAKVGQLLRQINPCSS
ncbi:hypothetical protein PsorP6_008692 [Peronosclerospora sorghi]|uniref:Uncharacterized protein n=1 Tax=Peronosclerospora sorghi TaxID=230839 RepID=A0ACC0W177_9STRA|nr:hypothetical protein PsorP6_008692 [Peronosclerospora sorghi]